MAAPRSRLDMPRPLRALVALLVLGLLVCDRAVRHGLRPERVRRQPDLRLPAGRLGGAVPRARVPAPVRARGMARHGRGHARLRGRQRGLVARLHRQRRSRPTRRSSDAFWLAFYPLAYVAMIKLLRARLPAPRRAPVAGRPDGAARPRRPVGLRDRGARPGDDRRRRLGRRDEPRLSRRSTRSWPAWCSAPWSPAAGGWTGPGCAWPRACWCSPPSTASTPTRWPWAPIARASCSTCCGPPGTMLHGARRVAAGRAQRADGVRADHHHAGLDRPPRPRADDLRPLRAAERRRPLARRRRAAGRHGPLVPDAPPQPRQPHPHAPAGEHGRPDRARQPPRAHARAGGARAGRGGGARAAAAAALRPRRLQELQRLLRAPGGRRPADPAGRAPAGRRGRARRRPTAWAATSSACWRRGRPAAIRRSSSPSRARRSWSAARASRSAPPAGTRSCRRTARTPRRRSAWPTGASTPRRTAGASPPACSPRACCAARWTSGTPTSAATGTRSA